jgi:hypothetical protein
MVLDIKQLPEHIYILIRLISSLNGLVWQQHILTGIKQVPNLNQRKELAIQLKIFCCCVHSLNENYSIPSNVLFT